MKYYKYELKERLGDYENYDTSVIRLEDEADLEHEAHKLAMENRGSELDDWDDYMEAYWFDGQGVTFVPTLMEIDEETFNVLARHL